jgi:hypothetical protein
MFFIITPYFAVSVLMRPASLRSVRRIESSQVVQVEKTSVDGHPHSAVYVKSGESLDIVHRGDASSGRNLMPGRVSEAFKPRDIRALHHPLLVDISAQKARAERFHFLKEIPGRPIGRFLPTLDNDAASLAVERKNDAITADRLGKIAQEGTINSLARECRGSDDNFVSTLGGKLDCSVY